MSDDDRLDFSQIYPEAGRNRKRFAANPRKPKATPKPYGFLPEREQTKEPRSTPRDLAKRYDDGDRPRPSMDKQIRSLVAKDLNRSAKSIAAELDRQGYEAAPLTVSSIREQMIATLRLCKKHGSIVVPAWDEDQATTALRKPDR
ncbi:hypothetical protein ACVWWO_006181 [Bradyrhizobium sp. F1.13.1]